MFARLLLSLRLASVALFLQEMRELLPIEPPPISPEADQEFKFAICKNKHENTYLEPVLN
jgi:hypothetical protein